MLNELHDHAAAQHGTPIAEDAAATPPATRPPDLEANTPTTATTATPQDVKRPVNIDTTHDNNRGGRAVAESASTAATDNPTPRHYDRHHNDKTHSTPSKISDSLLWKANLAAAILHFVQFVAQLGLAIAGPTIEDFTLPLTLTYQFYDDVNDRLTNARKDLGDYRVAFFLPAFLLASALAHLTAVVFFKQYIRMIGPGPVHLGINRWRWIEYSISSSLMIWPIAAFFGVFDLMTLLLIVAINASTMLFGWLMEELNLDRDYDRDSHAGPAAATATNAASNTPTHYDALSYRPRRKTNWLPFIFGCWTGVWPWVVIFVYFATEGVADEVPNFVWAVLAIYLVLYNCFALNQALQYCRCGPWRDYRFGELGFIVLSLVAKSLLAWVVFGGTTNDEDIGS